ncbi:MAG: hypothetical protein RL336_1799 [Pseudomonadota bacterium]|jgi:two-component system phosphate regulon response regulator PhoB
MEVKKTMQAVKILVIDDEPHIRDMLRMALELSDFEVLEAGDIKEGYVQIIDHNPHVVLLDWMLPGGTGISFLERLRKDQLTADLPVIMVTAKHDDDNKVQGLNVGADDYITKPFAPKEVVARIHAVLRRSGVLTPETVIKVKDLVLDMAGHQVTIKDRPVEMGPTEFKMLAFFLTHQDRAYSRAQLLDHVWGGNVYIEERTIDVHIRRLRKALDEASSGVIYGNCIQTVRGTGYRFSTKGLS